MADVNQLLKAMGFVDKLHEGMEAMLKQLHENLAATGGFSEEAWGRFEADMRSQPIDQLLLDQIRQTVDLTPEEMDQVVAFYESPKGSRIMEKMQLVNGAVDRAMQSWLEPKMKAAIVKVDA